MKVASSILAASLVGSAAHAQYFEVVINTPGNNGVYPFGSTLEYSVWLRDGDQFTDFVGWASFAGRIIGPGTHNLPDESGVQDTTSDIWEGRRPPATFGFPGGAAGGFRFAAQNYTAIPNGLEGSGGLAFEGLAASVPLGGFLHDGSPDIEVFRGSFVMDVLGFLELEFVAVDAAYFRGDFSTTEIGVQSRMGSVTAPYGVPTPGTAFALGAGLLATRRRR